MKKQILVLVLGTLLTNCFAQDPTFSVFEPNRIYYNPAFAGIQGTRMALNHRKQWGSVISKFNTTNFSIDTQNPNRGMGLGAFIQQNTEGEGFLKTLTMKLIVSQGIRIQDAVEIRAGFSYSRIYKSIDWSKLQFSDQFDPVYGLVRPSSAVEPDLNSKAFNDYDFGFLVKCKPEFSNLTHTIGASLNHLGQADESFFNSESAAPEKFVFSYSLYPEKRSRFKVRAAPHVMFEKQNQFKSINFGVTFIASPPRQAEWAFTSDFSFRRRFSVNQVRSNDAVILVIGCGKENDEDTYLRFYYSYDFTISALANHDSGGTHELSVVLNLDQLYFLGLVRNRSRHRFSDCKF